MILVACTDEHGGLLFNRRRQSRDRAVVARLLSRAGTGRLWMNAYSAGQFPDARGLFIDENFLEKAGPGDYCFVEDFDPSPFAGQAEQLILYRWNRAYPADLFFTLPLSEAGWKLLSSTDFPGFSHSKLTEEVYSR